MDADLHNEIVAEEAQAEYVSEADVKEEQFQERRAKNLEWLSENGLSDTDIMEDEQGEYVYVDEEDGLKKKYLPFANETDLIF